MFRYKKPMKAKFCNDFFPTPADVGICQTKIYFCKMIDLLAKSIILESLYLKSQVRVVDIPIGRCLLQFLCIVSIHLHLFPGVEKCGLPTFGIRSKPFDDVGQGLALWRVGHSLALGCPILSWGTRFDPAGKNIHLSH